MRYRLNDYSVPTVYGFRDVLVKGFVDEVVILSGATEIARHPRSYDRGEFVFEPRHYLALLEQKPGALDQAAPLQGWILPEPLQHFRRLLEARMGNRGKREFIQVLRLMEVFPETLVADAALNAIRLAESVCATARRHGLTPTQLFTWRREARRRQTSGEEPASFVPAVVETGGSSGRKQAAAKWRSCAPRRMADKGADAQTGLCRRCLDKGAVFFRATHGEALAFGVLDARPPAPWGALVGRDRGW